MYLVNISQISTQKSRFNGSFGFPWLTQHGWVIFSSIMMPTIFPSWNRHLADKLNIVTKSCYATWVATARTKRRKRELLVALDRIKNRTS